jgi:hypothetical protein
LIAAVERGEMRVSAADAALKPAFVPPLDNSHDFASVATNALLPICVDVHAAALTFAERVRKSVDLCKKSKKPLKVPTPKSFAGVPSALPGDVPPVVLRLAAELGDTLGETFRAELARFDKSVSRVVDAGDPEYVWETPHNAAAIAQAENALGVAKEARAQVQAHTKRMNEVVKTIEKYIGVLRLNALSIERASCVTPFG